MTNLRMVRFLTSPLTLFESLGHIGPYTFYFPDFVPRVQLPVGFPDETTHSGCFRVCVYTSSGCFRFLEERKCVGTTCTC